MSNALVFAAALALLDRLRPARARTKFDAGGLLRWWICQDDGRPTGREIEEAGREAPQPRGRGLVGRPREVSTSRPVVEGAPTGNAGVADPTGCGCAIPSTASFSPEAAFGRLSQAMDGPG